MSESERGRGGPSPSVAQATKDRLTKTTTSLEARTLTTGTRIYASASNTAGVGIIDARKAVDGEETTIISGKASITALGLAGAGAFAFSTRDGQ